MAAPPGAEPGPQARPAGPGWRWAHGGDARRRARGGHARPGGQFPNRSDNMTQELFVEPQVPQRVKGSLRLLGTFVLQQFLPTIYTFSAGKNCRRTFHSAKKVDHNQPRDVLCYPQLACRRWVTTSPASFPYRKTLPDGEKMPEPVIDRADISFREPNASVAAKLRRRRPCSAVAGRCPRIRLSRCIAAQARPGWKPMRYRSPSHRWGLPERLPCPRASPLRLSPRRPICGGAGSNEAEAAVRRLPPRRGVTGQPSRPLSHSRHAKGRPDRGRLSVLRSAAIDLPGHQAQQDHAAHYVYRPSRGVLHHDPSNSNGDHP